MKKLFTMLVLGTALMSSIHTQAQGGGQKPPASPPATATATTASGLGITVNYSAPSLKGRTIGKDVEPKQGQVWRAGANNATVIEFTKDVTIQGKALPAGKYAFFTLDNGSDLTLIFSKNTKQWGAFSYKQEEDVLRVNVKPETTKDAVEQLKYTVSDAGVVSLAWGNLKVSFTAK